MEWEPGDARVHTLSSSSPERMAVSGVTPSSSSSAVPSMDLFNSFTRALHKSTSQARPPLTTDPILLNDLTII